MFVANNYHHNIISFIVYVNSELKVSIYSIVIETFNEVNSRHKVHWE